MIWREWRNTRYMCDVIAARWIPASWVHSQSAVHPQIGFILDSSATSLHRKREMYLPAQQWHGMAWHEVQQVFFESVFLVRVREQERRAKGE